VPDVARVGQSGRAEATERRVTTDTATRARVALLASEGLSPRATGRERGLSHETVRTILQNDARAR
jgi:DNA-binding CsgD family transcriptional regulator